MTVTIFNNVEFLILTTPYLGATPYPYTSSIQDLHPPQNFSSRDSPMHSITVYTFELYKQIAKSSIAFT